MANIVYILTNEAMPGIVKVGFTTGDIENRITQLSAATGVPLPFECYFAAEVGDCAKIEKILHQLFSEKRINPKREFFKVEPEKVVLAISIGDFTEVTPGASSLDSEEKAALDEAKARRPRLKLASIGIKNGDILALSRDEKITATVVDGGKVDFRGEILSLSAAAVKALQSLGYKTMAASGSEYWVFAGELLDERRQRIEEQHFNVAEPDDT